ncbi:MAG: cytidine deaminase [Bacteroidaceae bacterium]|nr:cytidine deaminase [Bacteroidaceae bacterium]
MEIHITVDCVPFDALSEDDRMLVEQAKAMTSTSYAPYSNFHVGAALRLKDGQIFTGSNQENAAFGMSLCAERTAFFAASAQCPTVPPVTIAIAARAGEEFTVAPVSPCGACRQALAESEARFHQPIRVLLYGQSCVYVVQSITDLLPLNFDGSSLPAC